MGQGDGYCWGKLDTDDLQPVTYAGWRAIGHFSGAAYRLDMVRPVGHHFNKEDSMLVLSRKAGERIMIGRDIVVTVVEVQEYRIRLGIDAPKDIRIVREELIQSEEPPRNGVE